jgi:hypothetical protein
MKNTLIVRLADGTALNFNFPDQADQIKMADHVQKLLASPNLTLELDGRLLIIPVHNIVSVEVSPLPSKLPANTIRGASIID